MTTHIPQSSGHKARLNRYSRAVDIGDCAGWPHAQPPLLPLHGHVVGRPCRTSGYMTSSSSLHDRYMIAPRDT